MEIKKHIPNSITALNLISGFIAIYLIWQGESRTAVWLIALAFIFDMADGLIARKLKVSSEIGVELDSLADSVSFVVAPAYLIMEAYLSSWLGLVAGSVIAVCGVFRLAKFNVSKSLDHFEGMSTPLFTISAIAIVLSGIRMSEYAAAAVFIALALLMVSRVRFPSMKGRQYLRYKYTGMAIIAIVLAIAATAGRMAAGIAMNLLLWALIIIPYASIEKQKRPGLLYLYLAGLAAVTLLSYQDPDKLIAMPVLYASLLSPLVEMARK